MFQLKELVEHQEAVTVGAEVVVVAAEAVVDVHMTHHHECVVVNGKNYSNNL